MIADSTYHVFLSGAERTARHLNTDASNLAFYVHQLSYRLPFETRAEDEMERAESALVSALDRVREARTAYAERAIHMPRSDNRDVVHMLSLEAAE